MTETSPMRPVKKREREEEGEVEVGVGTEGERLTPSPSSSYVQAGRIGLASVISTNRFSVLEDESAPPTPLEPLHSTPASGLVDV